MPNPQLTNCTECHQARAPELLDEHGVCTRCRLPVILIPPNPCTLDAVHTAAGTVGMTDRRPELEISTDWTGHAKPGHWYGSYYADWEAAHPGAWVRGELVPGGFYNGNRWGGSTLSWDATWFSKHGAKMPKGVHYIAPGRSMTRLTEKLNPSDTGVMRLQFRDD